MQFFFVLQDVELVLPHKKKKLIGLSPEELAKREAPLHKIYCGFIAWELIQAERLLGKGQALLVNPQAFKPNQLPLKIQSFQVAGPITQQLQPVSHKNKGNGIKPIRIALINGTGTMLGDTLVGSSVLEHAPALLKQEGIEIEVDVFTAWNARPGVEELWKNNPHIHEVFDSSPTIKQLQAYDAYWDFSSLLSLEGYAGEHFGDFYFNHFGVDPDSINSSDKLPRVHIEKSVLAEARLYLKEKVRDFPIVFLQAHASTSARSIPNVVLVQLLKRLVRIPEAKIVITSPYPKGLSNFERSQIINLSGWTEKNPERYFAVIALSDFVISVDTLALHLAMGAQKPGIGLFSLSDPSIRLKYSPQIKGMLIHNAQSLPYWNKHKHDDKWDHHKAAYESAWSQIDLDTLVEEVRSSIQTLSIQSEAIR